jgi:long-chain acyl-CoA synthetase
MEPIWLKRYPPEVPKTVDLDPDESLADIFAHVCKTFPQRPAFANFGKKLSFADLNELSGRFAAYLQTELALARGDRVAIMMPNLLQYPVALFGALRAGLVVVNLNPLYTSHELHHHLNDCGARVIVVVANSVHELAAVVAETPVEHVLVTEIGDLLGFPKRPLVNFVVRYIKRLVPSYDLPTAKPFSDALRQDGPAFVPPADLTGTDLAFLQYTGGTTGVAKGAMLTHANMVANTRQMNTWFAAHWVVGEEIVITALPLYHVYALTCNCFTYFAKGGLNVLITDPRDTKGMIREMRKWKFTAITGVNTLYQRLVEHPLLPSVNFDALKVASAGGMAVLQATAKKWTALTGKEILEGYGLSETSPVLTSNPADIDGYNGSIGLPIPNTDISLRNEEGNEVPIGEMGEICAKGPQVMAGYWKNPEATAAAMTDDGYFKTGDLATVDENGFFWIVDRKKDMILVSGFNVYPNEIENVLTQHPDILETACIGIFDDRSNEAVKVFVVLRSGAKLTEREIRDYAKEFLTPYKVPRYVEFRDELPKSNVGKILRRELRN